MGDPQRAFSKGERIAILISQKGLCALCGMEMSSGWHAHHVIRHSDGGITSTCNAEGLCPRCHRKKHGTQTMAEGSP